MIILSRLTGWGLAEVLDLDSSDFWQWLEDAQAIENEIAERMKR